MMLGPASWQAPLRRASKTPNLGRYFLVFSRNISSLRRTPKDKSVRLVRLKGFVPNKFFDPGSSLASPTVTPADNDLPYKISQEVAYAVTKNVPVVALETTIYTHGFPYPENVALALDLERIVRENGAVPATIGIVDGVARIGLTNEEITTLASGAGKPETMKVSRRDLPYILGMGTVGRKLNGGTTVSGTMVLAARAGIRVFGTGGLGGVHRGGQDSMDVSADLTELGRTPVNVISSGCKSFLDIPRTLEYLETQGVSVCTFADGRTGPIDFPAFYTRDSGSTSPMIVQDAKEAAAMIHAQRIFGTSKPCGILFANPIPAAFAFQKAEIDGAINQAVQEAAEQGFHGHTNTPFILSRIKDLTHGHSLPANRALIESNVAMAAKVAVELSKFKKPDLESAPKTYSKTQKEYLEDLQLGLDLDRKQLNKMRDILDQDRKLLERTRKTVTAMGKIGQPGTDTVRTSGELDTRASRLASRAALSEDQLTEVAASQLTNEAMCESADILVYGSVAVDLSCDYVPVGEDGQPASGDSPVSPQMHTSNIATVRPSVGGVGRNVALAAHRAGGDTSVLLRSFVAKDLAGNSIRDVLHSDGLYIGGIAKLPVQMVHDDGKTYEHRTAQYVAINDAKKDLVLAMADMSIFSSPTPLSLHMMPAKPKWSVVDANWHPRMISKISKNLKKWGSKVAYEPVSVPKSGRIFETSNPKRGEYQLGLFPTHSIDLATPNQHELAAMHATAHKFELFDTPRWWEIIDALGIPSSGARDRFVAITNYQMTDEGTPLQTVQLLPFIPTILTKLGSNGVLLTEILKPEDPRLTDPVHAPYILCRNMNGSTEIGGVYMRLFPAVEVVEDVVSVNGVGDTFLGVLVAGLSKGLDLNEDLTDIAQRGAVMTLRSTEAVSPRLGELAAELKALEPKTVKEALATAEEKDFRFTL